VVDAWDQNHFAHAACLAAACPERDSETFWIIWAESLRELRRYEEAKRCLARARALTSKKGSPQIAIQYGHLLFAMGDFAGATLAYREAIRFQPSHARGYIYAGFTLLRRGEIQKAIYVLEKGRRCTEGELDELYANLAFAHRAAGTYGEARNALLKALEIDPDYTVAKRALADIEAAETSCNG